MSFASRTAKESKKAALWMQRRLLSQSWRANQASASSSSRSRISQEPEKKHVHLVGLPRSATPADVMRLARQTIKDDGLVKNIGQARLDYNRFAPTGRAYITLNSGFFTDRTCKILRDTQMTSLPLHAFVSPLIGSERKRGERGRRDGAERAVLDGNGIGGGLDSRGCDVVVYGLPATTHALDVKQYLRKVGIVKTALDGEPDCEILRVNPPAIRTSTFTNSSKFLIRLKSVSEAHAFVRRMHLTYFMPEVWHQKFLMRAQVVY